MCDHRNGYGLPSCRYKNHKTWTRETARELLLVCYFVKLCSITFKILSLHFWISELHVIFKIWYVELWSIT